MIKNMFQIFKKNFRIIYITYEYVILKTFVHKVEKMIKIKIENQNEDNNNNNNNIGRNST